MEIVITQNGYKYTYNLKTPVNKLLERLDEYQINIVKINELLSAMHKNREELEKDIDEGDTEDFTVTDDNDDLYEFIQSRLDRLPLGSRYDLKYRLRSVG